MTSRTVLVLVAIATLTLSACSKKMSETKPSDSDTQPHLLETASPSTVSETPDPVVNDAKPLQTGSDTESLSADLDATRIPEESF